MCVCFFLIVFTLPIIVRTICLFDNFEKLAILMEFSRDTLKGWARGRLLRMRIVGKLSKNQMFPFIFVIRNIT